MKNVTLSFLGLFAITALTAQTTPTRVLDKENMREGESVEYCTHHKRMKEALQNPELKALRDAFIAEQEAMMEAKKGSTGTEKATVLTIPVVFHILHNGGVENISREQILDQVSILNRDYRLQNADANSVQAPFIGLPADVEIEFKLATKAPNGTCFSGITRTVTTLTNDGSNGQAQVNAVVAGNDVYAGQWPPNKYMNVYVCADIGGAAGYTFNPMGGTSMYYNGIFMLHNYTGSIGTSSVPYSRALTHEVGHWLNLSHTWGDNNNPGNPSSCDEDDHVQDTPLCIGVSSCSLGINTCDDTDDPNNYSSWATNVIDQIENYMDYSYCSKMFSQGQVTRMRNAANSGTSGRNNLWTASNLTATGVSTPLALCQAKFSAPKKTICVGETVQLTDESYNLATGWTWAIAGGTPSTSTSQNPTVSWSTPGTYVVTLTATDGSSNDDYSITFTVLPDNEGLPYVEGFEGISSFSGSTRWFIDNPGNNSAWSVTNTAGNSGSNSAKLANFGQAVDNIDYMTSGAVDLSSITSQTGATLSFRYAYRKKTAANTDVLKVYLSDDCGSSWDVRKTLSANTMSGGTSVASAWTPAQGDWVTVHMTNVTSQYWVSNFRFRFGFESDGGNNMYVDDINIYSGPPSDDIVTVGLEELSSISQVTLFPNPTDAELNIRFNAVSNQAMTVIVTDVTGKAIQHHALQAVQGENMVFVSVDALAAGSYFIQLTDGVAVKTLPFVVK